MIEAHLSKLRARDDISAEEEQAVRGLVSQVVEVPADRTVIRRGEELNQSMLLLSGWPGRRTCRAASGKWPNFTSPATSLTSTASR